MPDHLLRFPPVRHVLTASIKIADVQPLVDSLRRDIARILREMAAKESPKVGARLREIAEAFDVPITATPHCGVVPIRPRRDRP